LQEHSQVFEKQSVHYATAKELVAEMVKMVMVVPFSDKVMPVPPPQPESGGGNADVEVIAEPGHNKEDNAKAVVSSFFTFIHTHLRRF
jgi:hypothetical protein